MGNALDGLRIKTDRARKHIAELDREIRAFLDTGPYDVDINNNHKTGNIEWRLIKAETIPLEISAIAGDAIQNLRTSLDYLIWQLVLLNKGTPKRITSFPIAESFEEYTSAKFRRKIEGLDPLNILPAIDALKPYKTGNELLWRLHCLNNRDKHRLLLPAASAVLHHDLLPSQRAKLAEIYLGSHPDALAAPDMKGLVIKPSAASFPLEVGKVFFTVPHAEMEHDFKFTLGIAFNEVGIIQGEGVVETIHHFADAVDQIIGTFAPELFHFK